MKKEKSTESVFEIKEVKRSEIRDLLKSNMDLIVGNIERVMKEKRITQESLAHGICSEQQHVSYLLRKKSGITINVLGRIAKAMDVKLYELVK
jgi:DNA-binding Xre family transcriptional regulator